MLPGSQTWQKRETLLNNCLAWDQILRTFLLFVSVDDAPKV